MWQKIKPYVFSISGTLLVGAAAGGLTKDSMAQYMTLRQPALAPPGEVFPIVWSILYVLMGLAVGIIAAENKAGKQKAMGLYYLQLACNFLWPILFFRLQWRLVALVWLVLLLGLFILTMGYFGRIDRRAAWLLVPYGAWSVFALYLNGAMWWLNR